MLYILYLDVVYQEFGAHGNNNNAIKIEKLQNGTFNRRDHIPFLVCKTLNNEAPPYLNQNLFIDVIFTGK